MAIQSPHPKEFPRILLAEEDHEIRALWKFVLDRAGYEVISCDRQTDLRRSLDGFSDFDLVVCNVRLLDAGVKKTVLHRQQQSTFPPLVVITAYRGKQLLAQLSELEIMAVFDQPFQIKQQLATVRSLVPHGSRS